MKTIGILLIVVGALGILLGAMMFGDIGIAAWIGAVAALLSGFGFVKAAGEFAKLSTGVNEAHSKQVG